MFRKVEAPLTDEVNGTDTSRTSGRDDKETPFRMTTSRRDAYLMPANVRERVRLAKRVVNGPRGPCVARRYFFLWPDDASTLRPCIKISARGLCAYNRRDRD